MNLLLRILVNCLAIVIANRYVPGFIFIGSLFDLLLAGAVIGLINSFLKPIISFFAFPFILLTLGLFNVLINIALVLLADKLLKNLTVAGVIPALESILIFSLINLIFSHFYKKRT